MNFRKILDISEYVDWDAQIPVIRYKALDVLGCVEHGFSTRLGGISEGIYHSMNLSYTRGDEKAHVDENFRRFCSAIHMDWKKSSPQTRPIQPMCGLLRRKMRGMELPGRKYTII